MSSTHKKLTINATSSMMQVAFTAFLYFFLYKYLKETLGVEQLGVWSLILSFSSIANLGNMGLTSGLVKFVAEYIAENKDEKIGKLILTAFISLIILFFLISCLILWFADLLLPYAIDQKEFLPLAFSILPFSLASLSINSVSGVFTSVLEGYQKNYIRNFIYIISNVVMFAGTLLLTPVFQLKGVAIAQVFQSFFILITSLILMIRLNSFNRFNYWRWSNESFKELFNYGYKFQAVSFCQLLYEPTTKFLLGKYGGMSMLGYYEYASRLVNQFRALLSNANQVVIPVIAETVKTKSRSYLRDFYARMNRILLILALPLSTFVIVLAPFISKVWIGEVNADFTFSIYVLTISSIFNIMCGPAYFSCMGEGRLSLLVVVHSLMAVLNLGIGYLLGPYFGGYGIIIGWGLALTIGSVILTFLYNKRININFSQIFTNNDRWIILISAFIIMAVIVYFSANLNSYSVYINTLVCCLLFVLYIPVLIKNDGFKSFILKISRR